MTKLVGVENAANAVLVGKTARRSMDASTDASMHVAVRAEAVALDAVSLLCLRGINGRRDAGTASAGTPPAAVGAVSDFLNGADVSCTRSLDARRNPRYRCRNSRTV